MTKLCSIPRIDRIGKALKVILDQTSHTSNYKGVRVEEEISKIILDLLVTRSKFIGLKG